MKHFDTETTAKILADYENRSISTREIGEKYHIERADLARLAIANGIEPRAAGKMKNYKKPKGKRCPKCNKWIDIKGARYCCYCGTDIRSEVDLLIERQEKIFNIMQVIPANMRDDVQQTILDTVAYLKKER